VETVVAKRAMAALKEADCEMYIFC
jgi:hypothetical protein